MLFSNDQNLCSKAIINGVKAFNHQVHSCFIFCDLVQQLVVNKFMFYVLSKAMLLEKTYVFKHVYMFFRVLSWV